MRRLPALMIGLCLVACAAPPSQQSALDPVAIAPGVTLVLPRPGQLGRDVAAQQMVSARRGTETQLFDVMITVSGDDLVMVATDSLGRRAMTIRRHGDALSVDRASWLPPQLQAGNILADLALIYWPQDALRAGLAGAALDQQGRQRRIGDAIVIETDGWTGTARLDHRHWDYQLVIRSVEGAP